jgi:hypothetical protein
MRGLELLSPSHPEEVQTRSELTRLSVQIKERWPSLPHPLSLEWTETPLVSTDSSGVPWVIGPAERDPMRGSRERTVVPRKQRSRLKQIAKLGVPFQRLAIAHELNPEGLVSHLLPDLKTEPLVVTDAVARALVGAVPEHPGVVQAVQALDVLVCGATSGVPDRVWNALLDPIIFGIIAPTPPLQGQLCLWYPLAAWRW